MGVDGIEQLLKQILKTAVQCDALKSNELKCVNVDSTVQEKAIAFLTDARLYDKARKAIVKAARTHAIKLRQSDVRLGKQALAPEVECIAKGKAHKRYEFGCKVVLVMTMT